MVYSFSIHRTVLVHCVRNLWVSPRKRRLNDSKLWMTSHTKKSWNRLGRISYSSSYTLERKPLGQQSISATKLSRKKRLVKSFVLTPQPKKSSGLKQKVPPTVISKISSPTVSVSTTLECPAQIVPLSKIFLPANTSKSSFVQPRWPGESIFRLIASLSRGRKFTLLIREHGLNCLHRI